MATCSAIRITPDNVETIPLGARVEMFWGCPVDTGGSDWDDDARQYEEGIVIDYFSDPSGMFPVAHVVVATDEGRIHRISQFVEKGIGARLVAA